MIENGCGKGKINYTRKGARDAVTRMSEKKNQKIHAYECSACDAWHISRLSGRNENKKERRDRERLDGPPTVNPRLIDMAEVLE